MMSLYRYNRDCIDCRRERLYLIWCVCIFRFMLFFFLRLHFKLNVKELLIIYDNKHTEEKLNCFKITDG